MGNVLKNSQGNVLISNNNAFEISSSVDSNIIPENIKKDVTILEVTGTYEGSGGGGSTTTVVPKALPSTVYSVDSAGTIISFYPMGDSVESISCLSGSMLVVIYNMLPEPEVTDDISNCTIIATHNAGGRNTNFNRIVIYQVN